MLLDNVITGFQTALSLENLMYSFIGVFVGNLIGVLPGIGALAAISMLLPITYGLEPAGALMMLAGLYYGTDNVKHVNYSTGAHHRPTARRAHGRRPVAAPRQARGPVTGDRPHPDTQ